MKLMRKLTWVAATNNFTFRSLHIPGKRNIIADSLSRFQMGRFRAAAPQAKQNPEECPGMSQVMWS
ncbi:hypothetical protein DPMN_115124 [Dreissena polymorpha]|uniref:Uncharacterized protein n=1 Tax=Dreissena polymorpha TaxID=45954 RepID=A0A9D4QS68_DREPO|nr:hypothetical protein DPMN_115124 [Dreissena polymorpha]